MQEAASEQLLLSGALAATILFIEVKKSTLIDSYNHDSDGGMLDLNRNCSPIEIEDNLLFLAHPKHFLITY